MKRIGLTGGIGMGKSACADFLSAQGLPVIDTDHLARDLVQPGQPALSEIVQAFGPGMLNPAGALQREQLAALVFRDSGARQRLEAILHPQILEAWTDRIEQLRRAGKEQAVVVIPLLFETRAEVRFDTVVCLACSPETQHARLRQRGWSPLEIEQRLAAQWPISVKMERSDRVLWSEGSRSALEAQAARVFGPG